MAPLNPRLNATRERDFVDKRRRSWRKKLFRWFSVYRITGIHITYAALRVHGI